MPDKKTLMIVDDDADDRYFFKRAVKKINELYECLEAVDGHYAIEQLRAALELPDYIFLDINMPRMNGRECLAELKKDIRLKNIPVIIYSTSTHSEDVELSIQLGAAYYLSKSSDIHQLPEQIINAIRIVEMKLAS